MYLFNGRAYKTLREALEAADDWQGGRHDKVVTFAALTGGPVVPVAVRGNLTGFEWFFKPNN